MTELEATTLRKNGAKLYHHTKIAFTAAFTALLRHELGASLSDEEIATFTDEYWQAYGLDDIFHDLNAFGFQQLIAAGWNPFESPAEDWQPSPDCIDNPTTRGGVSNE